jgi:hypothetical protein
MPRKIMLFCVELPFYLFPKCGLTINHAPLMIKLSFWHKLAFLTNCCWIMAQGIKYIPLLRQQSATQSTILVIGLLMAYLVNTAVNLWTGLLFIKGKLNNKASRWLLIVNFLFLLAQLYLFFE